MLAYHFSRGLQETSYAHRSVLDCSLQLLTTSSCPPSIASTGCSTDHGTQYAPHFVMSWLDSQYKNTWLIRMLNCFFFFLFPGCLGGMIPATDRITNERQSNVIISQSLKFITVCWLPTTDRGGVASFVCMVVWFTSTCSDHPLGLGRTWLGPAGLSMLR